MRLIKGFSIVEMLIYSALSAFFVMLVLQFFCRYQRNIVCTSKDLFSLASLNAFLDSIIRDCVSAPANPRMWVSIQPESIIWKNSQGVIGFSLIHGKLVKVCRKINSAGKLCAASYSTLARDVHGRFIPVYTQNLVSAIKISLHICSHGQNYLIHKTVYLREGVIL